MFKYAICKKKLTMNQKLMIVYGAIVTAGLAILSLAITIIFKVGFFQSLRIMFGSFYVLFLPGFVITYLFFKEIDMIERIALSFALSIATVPLTLFYLNKLGVKITLLSSILTVLVIIAIASGISVMWKKREKKEIAKPKTQTKKPKIKNSVKEYSEPLST